ncbi:MAG: patatin family protein [Spirochaetia bacterium]|jgi:predicted patatin/cPLA2 family phospholipase|nr:patatin family protein [Spirochaetia bacterium]
MDIYDAILILEGGSMRGVFTAGVLDYLMEQNIWIQKLIGVSAGSCNAIDYVSRQIGRSRDCMIIPDKKEQYIHPLGMFSKKGLMDMEMLFDAYPNRLHPFDYATYQDSDIEMEVVMTNCLTGKAVYHRMKSIEGEDTMALCKASCSMPVICDPVVIDGVPYLDGGVGDSIPLAHAMEAYPDCKPIVILTRQADYRKEPDSKLTVKAMKRKLKDYPQLLNCLLDRPRVYNEEIEFVDSMEKEGKCFVMRPELTPVGQMERDIDVLTAFYQHGHELMERDLKNLLEFLKN